MAQGMEEGAIIQLITTHPQKKMKFIIQGNIDESRQYHGKCNKPDRKAQKKYDLIPMWDTKQKRTNKQIR